MSVANRMFFRLRTVLVVIALFGLVVPLPTYTQNEDRQGKQEKEDDCFQPDPKGNAFGLRRKCQPRGSSGGVARGDFNGDGWGDLAVGVPQEDVGSVVNAGAVNIIYGSPNGLTAPTAPGTSVPVAQIWHQDMPGVLETAEEDDNFGAALASGNFNGDQFSDLAIGVPHEGAENDPLSDFESGAVHILYGSVNGLTADGDEFIRGSLNRDTFGASLVWGNFNGDAFGDLAVGAPHSELTSDPQAVVIKGGRIVVFFGSASGLSADNRQLVSQDFFGREFGDTAEDFDVFGGTTAAADFDKDGFDDLAVGVYSESTVEPLTNDGMVQIIFGSAAGLDRFSTIFLTQDTPGADDTAESFDLFGSSLAVGDFDGDTIPDLAVGISFEDVGKIRQAGAVQIFFGPLTAVPVRDQFIRQGFNGIQDTAEEFDHFGSSLAAGFFNGDSFSDLAVTAGGEKIGTNNAFAGAVHVIYGSSSGLSGTGDQFFHQDTPGIPGDPDDFDNFGLSLTAWNFGRNQILPGQPGPPPTPPRVVVTADLVIGVPGEEVTDTSGVIRSNAGLVHVFYGTVSGLSASANRQTWHQDSPGVPGEVESGDGFGRALY